MTDYQSVLTQLLQAKPVDLRLPDYFLSTYYAFDTQQPSLLKTKFKSHIQTGLRQFKPLRKSPELFEEILQKLTNTIENFEPNSPGIALFARFQIEGKGKTGKLNRNIELTVLPVHQEPVNEFYIGKSYDVDQLLENNMTDQASLILSLERDSCCAYQYRQGKLSFLARWTNAFLNEAESQSVDNRSDIKRNTDTNRGLGWQNTNEDHSWLAEEEKRFLDVVAQKSREIHENATTRFQNVVIFHSAHFTAFLKSPKNPFHKLKTTLMCQEKVLKNENRILAETQGLLDNLQQTKKLSILNAAKTHYQRFTSGWNQVSEAAGNAQIARLFVRPKLKQPGWITAQGMVLFEAQEGARRVASVVPWLVRNVIAFGGEVIVLYENEFFVGEPDISASLRF